MTTLTSRASLREGRSFSRCAGQWLRWRQTKQNIQKLGALEYHLLGARYLALMELQ